MIKFFNKILRSFRSGASSSLHSGFLSAEQLRGNFFKRIAPHRGQVAVVMILIVAIGLIFYAVVLNLSRMSQVKTVTLIAAESTASSMASFMASYGQKIFEEQLGGRRKICAWTALFTALIMVVVIIIIIIIIIVSWGSAAPAAAALIGVTTATLAVIVGVMVGLALAFAIASLALQAAVVEPGITAMWNRMSADTLSITDQFVERGIQTALSGVVTDQVKIPDLFDGDTDTFYGYLDPNNPELGAKDKITRFGHFYTKRLKNIPLSNEERAIEEFVKALKEFVFEQPTGDNGWALSDKVDCSRADASVCCPSAASRRATPGVPIRNYPAQCDPCCQPGDFPNPACATPGPDLPECCAPDHPNPLCTGSDQPECCIPLPDNDCQIVEDCRFIDARPDCCFLATGDPDKCGDVANCDLTSPYGAAYPFVYDPHFDDPTTTSPRAFTSFREAIGRDDEHHLYRVNSANTGTFVGAQTPVWHEFLGTSLGVPPPVGAVPVPPGLPVPPPHVPRQPGFNLSDAGGFYPADGRTGIFPFFYKIADFGVDLRNLNYLDDPAVTYERQCHWCDAGFDDITCPSPAAPNWMPDEVPPHLDLSLAPPTATGLSGNGCVDNANTVVAAPIGGPNQKPQLLDKVNGVNTINTILAGDNACASFVGGWKRGGDRFCSNVHPYFMNCPKHGGAVPPCTETYDPDGAGPEPVVTIQVECQCDTSAGGARAPSNWPDDKLDDLLYASGDFITFAQMLVDTPVNILKATFEDWYPDAAYWIEPLCTSGTCPGSFTKKIRDRDNAGPPDPRCAGCPNGLPCDPICGGRTTHGDGISGNDPGEEDWSILHQVRRDIQGFDRAIKNWISLPPDTVAPITEVPQYVSDSCLLSTAAESTWCVPPAQPGIPNQYGEDECGCVTSGEAATFDINGNGVRGDLEDVAACLDWNARDLAPGGVTVDVDPGPGTVNVPVVGNYLKFLKCDQECNQANCGNLPRSLVPGFCELGFSENVVPGAQAIIDACLATDNPALSSVEECAQDCQLAADLIYPVSGNPIITQPFIPPDLAGISQINSCIDICGDGFSCTVPGCLTCNSVSATQSDYEKALCGFQGSCCALPPAYPGQNLFYDSIMAALNGDICGADWLNSIAASWPDWGMKNAVIRDIYRQLGSCWAMGFANNQENLFYQAVIFARDDVAEPCFPGFNAPPDCDYDTANPLPVDHWQIFTACLADLEDGDGCTANSPCRNLPKTRKNGSPYNIPGFEPGVISPEGGSCLDAAAISLLKNCLVQNPCDPAYCNIMSCGGGSLDSMLSCTGESVSVGCNDLALALSGRDDADIAMMQQCITDITGCGDYNPSPNCVQIADPTGPFGQNDLGQSYGIYPYISPDTADYATMLGCANSASCAACDGMSIRDPYTGAPNVWTFNCSSQTAYSSPLQVCAQDLENSCAWPGGWGQGLDPDDQPPTVPGPWHDAVVAASLSPGSSCTDFSVGGFRDLLTQSIAEAQVQVEKMRKRADFLRGLLQEALDISYQSPNLGIDNQYTDYGQPFLPAPPDAYPSADDFDLSDPRFTGFENVPLVIDSATGGIFNQNDPLFAGFLGPTDPWAPVPAAGGVLAEGNTQFTRFLDNGTPFDAWKDPAFCWGPDPTTDCGRPDLPCNNAKWPCQDPTQSYNEKTNRRVQDSPVERLIDARIQKDTAPRLPAVAIYGWRDLPKNNRDGLWHMVKVEVRTPRRCNDSCGLNGTSDPLWPRVRTYTKAWGLRRCYELDSTEGMVKVRVIRWDQDRQDWNLLKFPDGNSIWKVRFFHPGRGPAPDDVPDGLLAGHNDPTGDFCIQESDMDLRDLTVNYNENSCENAGVNCGKAFPWGYAFMLNRIPDFGAPGGSPDGRYANCWLNVHRVLEHGVVSESCAMYYFGNGMQVKFTRCDADFTRGLN